MEGTFLLRVLTPKATVFDGVVNTVTVSGCEGEFGVLPGHYAYITSVRPGILRFEAKGKLNSYSVGHGFAQVSDERVSLVLASCEEVGAVDVEATLEMLARAEKVLLEVPPGGDGYSDALVEQELALGQLSAADYSAPE